MTMMTREEMTYRFLDRFEGTQAMEDLATGVLDDPETAYDGTIRPAPALPTYHQDMVAPIEVGQIRLLSQPDTMVYVLVAREWWSNDTWLIVPFSPYNTPACPEEFLLREYGNDAFQTLQVWNAQTLGAIFLRRSWVAGSITPEEQRDVNALLSASLGGAPLLEGLAERTGIALPEGVERGMVREYKEKEIHKLDPLPGYDLRWMAVQGNSLGRNLRNRDWVSDRNVVATADGLARRKNRPAMTAIVTAPVPGDVSRWTWSNPTMPSGDVLVYGRDNGRLVATGYSARGDIVLDCWLVGEDSRPPQHALALCVCDHRL